MIVNVYALVTLTNCLPNFFHILSSYQQRQQFPDLTKSYKHVVITALKLNPIEEVLYFVDEMMITFKDGILKKFETSCTCNYILLH